MTAVFYIILHKDQQRTLILILNNKFLNSSQVYFFCRITHIIKGNFPHTA